MFKELYWKYGSNSDFMYTNIFSFAWKGTLRPNNSVQAYDLVDCQMQLIVMSQGKNGKITKVTESKLVLGAEFLFTTFSLDLVLTVPVFCVSPWST